MTNEEAQIVIGNIPLHPEVLDDCYSITDYQEAKAMAIEALEQKTVYYPPCIDCHKKMDEIRCAYDKLKEQQHCEDAISAAEAISRIEVRRKITCESDPYNYEEWTNGYEEGIDDAIAMINSVPLVTPQQKIGHWIEVTNGRGGHECDLCHDYAPSYQSGDEYLSKHCPNCGAKMQEVRIRND